jgi:hypothetical protein
MYSFSNLVMKAGNNIWQVKQEEVETNLKLNGKVGSLNWIFEESQKALESY